MGMSACAAWWTLASRTRELALQTEKIPRDCPRFWSAMRFSRSWGDAKWVMAAKSIAGRASDHEAYELVGGGCLRRPLADFFAPPHDDDAFGDGKYILHIVTDNDDGHPP